jgi:predicted acyltransferase
MALLGLLIQGGAATQAFPGWDLARLRYAGVLQRIAACFLLASAVAIYLPESRPPRAQVCAHACSA